MARGSRWDEAREPAEPDSETPHRLGAFDWLATNAAKWAFPLMVGLCVLVFWISYPSEHLVGNDWWSSPDWWVSLIAFLVLSGLPSWLYLRFQSVKLTPIYHEYVRSLYRLGVDGPRSLPMPLESSPYFEQWQEAQPSGRTGARQPSPNVERIVESHTTSGLADSDASIYDKKFEAYYGKRDEMARFSGLGSLLPVIAVWIAFAVGWLTIVCNLHFVFPPLSLEDSLRFGFLGAYVFSVQLTIRAFFQNDLRSGTYVGIIERLVVVIVLVMVIFAAWMAILEDPADQFLAVVAFIIGSFPLVGQEWLAQLVSSRLKGRVPSIGSQHPLSEIDGMNVWYEARLLEEGIEDIQNLATASIVDVVMHSRAPVGRIVDWIDQALLRMHLPPLRADEDKFRHESDVALLQALNALGVRTATDLLGLYSPLSRESVRELHHEIVSLEPEELTSSAFHSRMLDLVPDENTRYAVELRMLGILRCIGSEPNLRYVLNWKTDHGTAPAMRMDGTSESMDRVSPDPGASRSTEP